MVVVYRVGLWSGTERPSREGQPRASVGAEQVCSCGWNGASVRDQVQVPSRGSARLGLRIRRCRDLWYRSQTRLGSEVAVAVAVAGGYSSD